MSDDDLGEAFADHYEHAIDIETDPFEVTLDDVYGLAETCEKIQNTFVTSLTRPSSAVQLPSIVLFGPEGTGVNRVGKAVAGELASNDYSIAHLPVEMAAPDDRTHRGEIADGLAEYIRRRKVDAPVAILLTDFQEYGSGLTGSFYRAVQDIRKSPERVAVIGAFSEENRRTTGVRNDGYVQFADVITEPLAMRTS